MSKEARRHSWDGKTDTLRGWATAEKANGRLAVSELLRDAASELDSLRRSLKLGNRNAHWELVEAAKALAEDPVLLEWSVLFAGPLIRLRKALAAVDAAEKGLP